MSPSAFFSIGCFFHRLFIPSAVFSSAFFSSAFFPSAFFSRLFFPRLFFPNTALDTGPKMCDIWFHRTELGWNSECLFGHHEPKNESRARVVWAFWCYLDDDIINYWNRLKSGTCWNHLYMFGHDDISLELFFFLIQSKILWCQKNR